MTESQPTKIVYLFGAGATHAELINAEPIAAEAEGQRGLLMSHVSSRVIEKARRDPEYIEGVEAVSGTRGSLNIELLISLIESCKVEGWERKTKDLKEFVRKDIEAILTPALAERFYLHKALFELHADPSVERREQLLGLISLNYESVMEHAYETIFRTPPDFCLSLEKKDLGSEGRSGGAGHPILKLHGSFDWFTNGVPIRGKRKKVDIIPLGAAKRFDHTPYVFIWSRALEMLVECDKLRVIGCSLSQNDAHLIELLFKAQVESGRGFDIEIIAPQQAGQDVRNTCGFFRRIYTLNEIEGIEVGGRIEGGVVAEASQESNPFREWLKYKSDSLLGERVQDKQYLSLVAS